jgi:hypothetical protein
MVVTGATYMVGSPEEDRAPRPYRIWRFAPYRFQCDLITRGVPSGDGAPGRDAGVDTPVVALGSETHLVPSRIIRG